MAKLTAVNLIWVAPWPIGGFASFTGHLYQCLEQAGVSVKVLRPNRNRSESTLRTASHAKFAYHNVTVREALKETRKAPTIVTSVAPEDVFAVPNTIRKLMHAGAHVVVHGIQEFKQFPIVPKLAQDSRAKLLVIRKAMQSHITSDAGFLPHPYLPAQAITTTNSLAHWKNKAKIICTLGMIANLKHPKLLCQYNQERKYAAERIALLGKETTHWLGLGLRQKYSHYRKPKFDSNAERSSLALPFKFQVDMSAWEGDGGGTQYSFLEAMDAGCVNILNKGWRVSSHDEMASGINCEYAGSTEDIRELVSHMMGRYAVVRSILDGNLQTLAAHSPAAIVKALGKLL